ncbi:hypothetical protein GHK92_03555 [Nocardioides sp. dk4132]|uniref:hypothetical protein n=1 Tax=unclassified Nocardioides TaxID=2615069 RepID=UPI001294AFEA|nr:MULTISPECIES: hypothetical protein [unclassified Nocardioides]MQW74939.1 hypothetical protein [Nocardioides sp. dk4132]QGA07875.1 hypothetical protein GFH29_11055 [Nocardioides sp. dk884]
MSTMAQRGAVTWRLILATASAIGVVSVTAWYFFGQSEPTPWNKPARVDGAVVQLTYTGSECRDGARADVDEDPKRVTITVRETVRAMSCSDVGVSYDIHVRLDAPLGDRELVDGACQMPKYAHYIVCGQNKTTVEPISR